MDIREEIINAIEQGKIFQTRDLVQRALAEGISPGELLNGPLMQGMKVVGRRFSRGGGMVSDTIASTKAINESLELLKPLLVPAGREPIGRACIGTVQGDLHDIGKNIVRLLLENRGIEIIDLGVDVAPEAFVRAVVEDGCELVCCSALLSSTMQEMKRVVDALKRAGVRDRVLVMVGGLPVTERFCRRIGADIYTTDGFEAAEKAEKALLELRAARRAVGLL